MRKWLPLVAVCLGTVMLLVDVTIVNVALPAMAGDLGTSFGSLQWVINGYALALAALLLGLGGVADRVGHRRAFLVGTAVFALASLGCGLAATPAALVVFRVVQGAGGAAMIATTFALLNAAYGGRDRGVAYGVWGAVSGASQAIGPLLGGPLTEYLSWRWIFFVNLPVSVATVVLGLVVLRERHTGQTRRVDVAGVLLFSAAIAVLTFGMTSASERGWGSPTCWLALVLGAVFLAVFVVVETRTREPLFEPALLRNRILRGTLLAALLLNAAAYVSLAYTSIWMQSVLELSPVTAGLVALPMSAATFATSAAFGRLLHRISPARVIGGGLLLVAAGDLLGYLLVSTWPSWPALLPGFFLVGAGVGLATAPLAATGTAAVPAARGGMAGGAVYTARQVGVAFGIALLGVVFTAGTQHTLAGHQVREPGAVAHAVTGGRSAELLQAMPGNTRHLFEQTVQAGAANGIAVLLAGAGVIGLAGAVIAFRALAGTPQPAADTPVDNAE